MEEETERRVEEAIRKKVEERLSSEYIKMEIKIRLEEGRKKVVRDVVEQLEREKEAAVIEATRKEVFIKIFKIVFMGCFFFFFYLKKIKK